jgi:hypothetical protein
MKFIARVGVIGFSILMVVFFSMPYLAAYRLKDAADRMDLEAVAAGINSRALTQSLDEKVSGLSEPESGDGFVGLLFKKGAELFLKSRIAMMRPEEMVAKSLRSEELSITKMAYQGLNSFRVGTDGKTGGYIFRREGLFSWKLSGVQ